MHVSPGAGTFLTVVTAIWLLLAGCGPNREVFEASANGPSQTLYDSMEPQLFRVSVCANADSDSVWGREVTLFLSVRSDEPGIMRASFKTARSDPVSYLEIESSTTEALAGIGRPFFLRQAEDDRCAPEIFVALESRGDEPVDVDWGIRASGSREDESASMLISIESEWVVR